MVAVVVGFVGVVRIVVAVVVAAPDSHTLRVGKVVGAFVLALGYTSLLFYLVMSQPHRSCLTSELPL